MVKKYRKLKHQRVKQQNWKRSKNLSTGSHIQGCKPPAGLHKGGRVAQAERSPNGINRSLLQSPGPFWLLWPNAIGRAAYKQQGLISHSLEAGESKMKAPWDWASDEGRFLLNRWHVLSVSRQGQRDQRALWGLFYKSMSFIHYDLFTSRKPHLQILPSWGFDFYTWVLWGHRLSVYGIGES